MTLSLALPGVASADQFGIQVAGGIANSHAVHVNKVDLGAVLDPQWSWWAIAGWTFTAGFEGRIAYRHSSTADKHDNIFEFGVTPVLRFIKSSGAIRPYVEAGVGVGASFGSRQLHEAGFRFQHLSNAHIKEPNPGMSPQAEGIAPMGLSTRQPPLSCTLASVRPRATQDPRSRFLVS
jgi:hypothetical protein